MNKIWVDIESPLGTPLGSGPIMTARNLRYVDRESRVGEFVFEMSIADPQSALVSGDRYAKFYTIMNNARTLLGTGIIETITVSISPQGEPTKTVSGPNLMGELGWRTMKDLAIYTTETRTPDSVQYYDGTAVSYLDMTDTYDGNDATGVAVPADDEDWIYVGDADPWDITACHLGTNRNSDPGNFKVEYSKGSGSWGSGTILSDTTKANEVDDPASPGNWGASWWTVDGQIRWERKSDWATDMVNSVSGKYWLRFRYSEDMSAALNGGQIDVNEIEIIQELPVDTGPADILAYATAYGPNDDKDWAFASNGYYSATASDVMMKFSGQSVMEALIKMAEITGEHFRLGTGREIEWLQTDQTASGVRAVLPSDAIAGLGDTGLYYIRSFRQSSDAYEIITRVNPHGAGQGSARVSLVNCSDSASAGFTLTKASNLLVYDTAESIWNKRERAPFWKMIGSPTVGNMLDSQASNALLKMAERYLLVHSAPQVAYDLRVAKIDSLVRPGDTIRVEYLRVIDGVKVVDVDAGVGLDLYILETILETGQVGPLTMTLKVATIDAWPDTDDSAVDSALSEFEVFQAMDSPLNAGSLTASSLAAIVASLDLSLYYRKPTNTNVILGLDAGNGSPGDNRLVLIGKEAGYSLTNGVDNVFIGWEAGYTPTTGDNNTAIGTQAMRLAGANASFNVAVGYEALEDVATTSDGWCNTAIGGEAGMDLDTGEYNVAVGYAALHGPTHGDGNVAVGAQAMDDGTGGASGGSYNTALGYLAMLSGPGTGNYNIAIGMETLGWIGHGAGASNIAIGYRAMWYNQESSNNVVIGHQAGYGPSETSYDNCVLIGYQAGYGLLSGDDNIAIGYQAGLAVTTAVDNILVGSAAASTLVDGDRNVVIGFNAMVACGTNASHNIAIGYLALENVGTSGLEQSNVAVGSSAMEDMDAGSWNVAIGASAMENFTSGDCNVAIGEEALKSTATGSGEYNVAIGYNAMIAATSGHSNVAVGPFALGSITTGDYNIAIGREAMEYNAESNNNIIIGYQAGYKGSPTTYDDCVIIGYQAGYVLETGDNNVLIGHQAGLALTGAANVFIGYLAGSQAVGVSNQLYISNSNTATPLIYGEFDNNLIKVTGTVEATVGFIVEQVGTPTYKYLQDWMNTTQSAGLISGGAITATSYAIHEADDVAETFKIVGDVTAYFADGVEFTVSGSTGNDGDYTTVGNSTFGDGDTTITVADVPDGTNDGDIADGRVDVALGKGMIRTTDDAIDGVISFFDWPANSNVLLADNDVNWLYATYGAGTPAVAVTATYTDIDHTTEMTIGRVYREGTTVHILKSGTHIYDAFRRQHRRDRELRRVERATGAVISDEGTLKIKVTAGILYSGIDRLTTAEVDTSGAGRFRAWYHTGGGGWTSTGYPADQTDIDSANYDTGTGLAALAANRYGVYWVFLDFDSHIHVVYGRASYKLHEAQAAELPATPDICSEFSVLVARIIAAKDATEITEAASAFVTPFMVATPASHAELADLEIVTGGHTLTGAQWSLVGATALNTIGLLTPSADVSAGAEAILKSNATGDLALHNLTLTNDLLLADAAVVGITGNERIQFNAAGTIQVLGADVLLGSEDGLGKLNFDEGTTIADGIVWGSDANKVTLYRSADDMLKTDDSLTVLLGFNVGTATGAGTGRIHLQATVTPYIQLTAAAGANPFTIGVATGADHFFTGTAVGEAIIRAADNAKLHLGVDNAGGNNIPAITILESGFVGLGVSPSFMLDLLHDAAAVTARFFNDGDNNNRLGILVRCGTDDQSGDNDFLICQDGGGVGAGRLENDDGLFQLEQPSDRRIKRNIRPTASVLARLRQVPVMDFEMRRSGGKHRGFVAQDLLPIFPELVRYHGDERDPDYGTYGTRPLKMIPINTKAVQELDAILNDYKQNADAEREAIRAEMASHSVQIAELQERLDEMAKTG